MCCLVLLCTNIWIEILHVEEVCGCVYKEKDKGQLIYGYICTAVVLCRDSSAIPDTGRCLAIFSVQN